MPAPPIAALGALIGDPARALMLSALMDGCARTATELAVEAGIGRATASAHLAKLTARGLLSLERQGRHRYFRLASDEVASVLESLMVLGASTPPARHPPREDAEREARSCYDHLAGRLGVELLDALGRAGHLALAGDEVVLSPGGRDFFLAEGVDIESLERGRRRMARLCLDWSERRHHLAGALGAALFDGFLARGWIERAAGSRAVRVTARGRLALRQRFGVDVVEQRPRSGRASG